MMYHILPNVLTYSLESIWSNSDPFVCLQALKILKTPEFMPYVIFIASPPLDDLREIHKRATSEGTITKKQTVSARDVWK